MEYDHIWESNEPEEVITYVVLSLNKTKESNIEIKNQIDLKSDGGTTS